MSGGKPDPDRIGYAYMLKGGSVGSADRPGGDPAGRREKGFVSIPPHLMILNARLAEASGFPSGKAHPDTHRGPSSCTPERPGRS